MQIRGRLERGKIRWMDGKTDIDRQMDGRTDKQII